MPPLWLSAPASPAEAGYVINQINHKKLFRLYREEKLAVRRSGGRNRAIGNRAPRGSR
jgi:hypothetical protein